MFYFASAVLTSKDQLHFDTSFLLLTTLFEMNNNTSIPWCPIGNLLQINLEMEIILWKA